MPREFTEEQSELIATSRNSTNASLSYQSNRKLLIAIGLMVNESAGRIIGGMYPVPMDYLARWSLQLYQGQITEGRQAAQAGYESALSLLRGTGDIVGDSNQIMPSYSLYRDEVDTYFKDNSELQANTIKRKMEAINKKVMADATAGGSTETVTLGEYAESFLKESQKFISSYAKLVAVTGMVWASNEGVIKKYKEAGVQRMRWYTVMDERTCIFCMAQHGKVVEIGGVFEKADTTMKVENDKGTISELQMPSWDISHPPLHCHCRCIVLPE